MVYLLIAFRNLARQKRRTILLAGAIAFGVLIITLLNGFTAGIIASVENNMAQLASGHIFISGKERTESGNEISLIRDDSKLESAVRALAPEERNSIAGIVKRSSFIGTLVFGKQDLHTEGRRHRLGEGKRFRCEPRSSRGISRKSKRKKHDRARRPNSETSGCRARRIYSR